MKYLIDYGADVNAAYNEGVTVLIWATQRGRLVTIEYIVNHCANVSATTTDGSTGLVYAAYGEHLNALRYLAGCSVDLNTNTSLVWLELMTAAQRRSLDIVKFLVDLVFDANTSTTSGTAAIIFVGEEERANEALIAAVCGGTLDVERYLIYCGPDLNGVGADEGTTALMTAAGRGQVHIVKYLVDHAANVNATSSDASFLLQSGVLGVVEYLADHGAVVNATTINGMDSFDEGCSKQSPRRCDAPHGPQQSR